LTRDAIEVINTPGKIIKPRRFDVLVSLKGQVWRRIQIEIAPDEAGASSEQDILTAPGLHHFGLPSPDHLVGIAMRFQIAQKIHAGTDPHDPPGLRNDRARDIVDLLLLRDLVNAEQAPAADEVVFHPACRSTSQSRPRSRFRTVVLAHDRLAGRARRSVCQERALF
jgi:hypothetical protein